MLWISECYTCLEWEWDSKVISWSALDCSFVSQKGEFGSSWTFITGQPGGNVSYKTEQKMCFSSSTEYLNSCQVAISCGWQCSELYTFHINKPINNEKTVLKIFFFFCEWGVVLGWHLVALKATGIFILFSLFFKVSAKYLFHSLYTSYSERKNCWQRAMSVISKEREAKEGPKPNSCFCSWPSNWVLSKNCS